MAPKGPYKLCTVNTAPERAKRLVGRVVEDVKEEYTIHHVENAESMCLLLLFFNIDKNTKPTWVSELGMLFMLSKHDAQHEI